MFHSQGHFSPPPASPRTRPIDSFENNFSLKDNFDNVQNSNDINLPQIENLPNDLKV
jgi:hypothetical protein